MTNKIPKNSLILGEGEYFDLDCYKTKVNNNVLVVGTAGSGKTRSLVTPNLLQATGSYVVSDPKGNLYKNYGGYLRSKGYKVRMLNFMDPENSIHYNFFKYIRNEQDILKIANMIVYGANKGNYSGNDPFWDKAAEMLLTSLIGYLWTCRPENEQTVESILKLLYCLDIEEGYSTPCTLDRIFDEVEKRNPTSMAVQAYKGFKAGAARTKRSIAITLTSDLHIYVMDGIKEMMQNDETDIAKIGHEKTAFFVQVSDSDRSLDPLANLFFTQAMNELVYEADNNCKDYKLPVPVRFILDDFATNVTIGDFPRMISSIRSRNISAMLMLQAESQLTQNYGCDGRTIVSNCDSYVYLGCNDLETAESISRRVNEPISKVLYMPVETGWLLRRGQQPVKINNFDLESHRRELMAPGKKVEREF